MKMKSPAQHLSARFARTIPGVTILFALLCAWPASAAPNFQKWAWRNPTPTGNDLRDIARGNGRDVMVGASGTILWASAGDTNFFEVGQFLGPNQTPIVPFTADLNSVAFGNGVWVAVGDLGVIMRSATGSGDWERVSSGVVTNLRALRFEANTSTFVGVGDGGTILTSTNGRDWAPQDSGTTEDLLDVEVFGSGPTLVTGNNGTILRSADHVAWNPATVNFTGAIQSVSQGNGEYLAVGINYFTFQGVFLRSTDAINWSAVSTNFNLFASIVFGETNYFLSSFFGQFATTEDGTAVNVIQSEPVGIFRIRKLAGAAPGSSPAGPQAAGEPSADELVAPADGGHWYKRLVEPFAVSQFTFEDGTHPMITAADDIVSVLIGYVTSGGLKPDLTGFGSIVTSTDGGQTWKTESVASLAGEYHLSAGVQVGNRLVAVGLNSAFAPPGPLVATDTNGENWAAVTSNIGNRDLLGLAFGAELLVAVGHPAGGGGAVLLTADPSDLSTWTSRFSGADPQSLFNLNHVVWTGTNFITVGNGGIIRTSVDGLAWTTAVPGVFGTPHLNKVAFDAASGTVVAVGQQGLARTAQASSGFQTWNTIVSGTTENITAVGSDGMGAVLTGTESGQVFLSRNGGDFELTADLGRQINAFLYYPPSDSWFAFGQGGMIRQTTPIGDSTPPPRLVAPGFAEGGVFQFTVISSNAVELVIDASEDLKNWIPMTTNPVPPNGQLLILDSAASNHVQRFYRAHEQ